MRYLITIFAVVLFVVTIILSRSSFYGLFSSLSRNATASFVLMTSLIFTLQGLFTLVWMLYAWENPHNTEEHRSPKQFRDPHFSFTALLPARHEEKVIRDTIIALNKIDYPEELKEVIVLCRKDDHKTITRAQETISELGKKNIRLVTFDGFPINKPYGLNQGLKVASKNVITIFDAEDEPHEDIYNVVNTIMVRDRVDVVQSGVQLMNHQSHWFSALNVMEYYLWFKSGLHFFSRVGRITPLGGNTVFFKKHWLDFIGGWDEHCLTEDADIGIRLTLAGATTRVVYDEKHSTQEETPTSATEFVKQRTRWNQGFLQIFLKGDWKKLPTTRQKIMSFYILLSPIMQSVLFLLLPFGVILALTQKLPVWVTLASFIPLYIFILQLLTFIIGLFRFTREYNLSFSPTRPIKLLLAFYPYQLLLVVASFRAFYRVLTNNNAWEKTLHTNAHRKTAILPVTIQYAKQNTQ